MMPQPSASPETDSSLHASALVFLPAGRRVDAGNGADWLRLSWPCFKRSPFAWILAGLIFLVFTQLLTAISGFNLLSAFLTPVLIGGLMHACARQDESGKLDLGDLGRGALQALQPLALLGLASLAILVLSHIPVLVFMGPEQALAMLWGESPDLFHNQGGWLPVCAGLGGSAIISLALSPALMLSPALVTLQRMPPAQALKASFFVCWKNWLAGLIYTLCTLVLFCLGVLPLGLGLLVVLPLFLSSIYRCYRDVFFTF